jgi:hypothetical protein
VPGPARTIPDAVTRRLAPLLLVLAAGACGRRPPEETGGGVQLVLDGRLVATVEVAQAGARLCLPDLLPPAARDPATWVMLDVHATDGRRLAMPRPATTHPEQDFCLYRRTDRDHGFGVYRRDGPALPPRLRELLGQPAPYLEPVGRVQVRTVETPQEAAFGSLTVVVDGGEGIAITPGMLDGLGAAGTPGAGGERQARAHAAAWPLRDVLGLVVEPGDVASLRLADAAGVHREVPVESLAGTGPATPVLKRNRRGDHHLRMLEGLRLVGELRGVVRIEVRTRAGR